MHRMRIALTIAGILLAFGFSLPSFGDGVPTLSIDPASSSVSVGDKLTFDVNISNITDLYAFQFDLNFNPATVAAVSITEGAFLASGGATFFLPGTIDNVGGTIMFNADSLVGAIPGVSGNGTLVEFDFTALAPGTSTFSIENVLLQDSTGALLDSTTTSGSVTVQGSAAVPEPSSLVLLMAAVFCLLLLCGFKRP